MFPDPKQILRLCLETSFEDDRVVNLDFGSYVRNERIAICSNLICLRELQSEIDIPLQQKQLLLNETN